MKQFRYDELPVISTTGGDLRGYAVDDIYMFKGIPYAKGERFKMPVPYTWEGVRECASYGVVCPLLNESAPNNELAAPHMYWVMDEHCQNLNIWTPCLEEGAKKPVMVWFHGGGYSAGSAVEQLAYDGTNMAHYGDVVVVSVNHRLNIFGYLDGTCLGEEFDGAGCAGHGDMVAALQWVHDNIAKFGGDPENVTIFGQSGGGMKVHDLMQIPAADGLFKKGIMMSGVAGGDNVGGILGCENTDSKPLIEAMLKELGIAWEDRKELAEIDAQKFMAAYKKCAPDFPDYNAQTPKVGEFFKGWPLKTGFRREGKDITFLVGSVFGEFGCLAPVDRHKEYTDEEKMELIKGVYKENTEAVLTEFGKLFPEKDVLDVVYYDRIFRIPNIQIAKAAAAKGGTAYLYQFDLSFPYEHNKPAWHCSDIPFFFHNVENTPICMFEDAYKLQDILFGAVMRFAHTGDPNGGDLPVWPKAESENVSTFIFDKELRVIENFDDKLIEACEIAPRIDPNMFSRNKTQH